MCIDSPKLGFLYMCYSQEAPLGVGYQNLLGLRLKRL
jgi:hypothetical protein